MSIKVKGFDALGFKTLPPVVDHAVLDLETTVNGPEGKKPDPMYGNNRIVMAGYGIVRRYSHHTPSLGVDSGRHSDIKNSLSRLTKHLASLEAQEEPIPLVGHNIKFDLRYLLKEGVLTPRELMQLPVYDTQLAEYILSGHDVRMSSLDELSEKYGGVKKIDEVKELWDAGVATEDIDPALLSDYLHLDLANTSNVFMRQMEEYKHEPDELWNVVWNAMENLKALAIIENTGMAIDVSAAIGMLDDKSYNASSLVKRLREDFYLSFYSSLYGAILDSGRFLPEGVSNDRELTTYVSDVLKNMYNPDSVKHNAAMFDQSIELPVEVRMQVGNYKNGKPKYKKEVFKVGNNAPVGILLNKTKAGNPILTEATLSHIKDNGPGMLGRIAGTLLEYRGLNKDVSTYLKPLFDYSVDGILYGNLNQCLTATGRLSSSKPNLQNQNNKSDIKQVFVSRFDDGVIVELDYSQLEVCVLAAITGDKQLKEDITNGRDIHREVGKSVYPGVAMTKEQRREVKGVVFGLIYGGTPGGLAKSTGKDKALVKRIADAFYSRYPGVAEWQERAIKAVSDNAYPLTGETTPSGNPQHAGHYYNPVGRKFTFKTYDSPEWSPDLTSFSPTEIKNYMIQGTASADIVLHAVRNCVVALLDLIEGDNCHLTNTVHDSIILDVREEYKDEAIRICKHQMESMPEVLRNLGWTDFDIPLTVGVSEGPNWKEQEEIEYE